MLAVAYIGSNANSQRNLAYGLETRTWAASAGVPALPGTSKSLLLANQFRGGSARVG